MEVQDTNTLQDELLCSVCQLYNYSYNMGGVYGIYTVETGLLALARL